MNPKQMENEVIIPILKDMGMYSKEAVALLLETIAQESNFEHIKQLGCGVALSLFQIEPRTAQDLHDNYLVYRKELKELVESYKIPKMDISENLLNNLSYSVVIARLIYWRVPEPIPKDLKGRAKYYKKYYNTVHGKATVEEYINNAKLYL